LRIGASHEQFQTGYHSHRRHPAAIRTVRVALGHRVRRTRGARLRRRVASRRGTSSAAHVAGAHCSLAARVSRKLEHRQAATIQVKVKPRARVSLLTPQEGGVWLAQLKSPPVDGQGKRRARRPGRSPLWLHQVRSLYQERRVFSNEDRPSRRGQPTGPECGLTFPSSGRPPADCACLRPPLMSNVRPHQRTGLQLL